MTFEPAPLDPFTIRVVAIRRTVERIEPPLDLRVMPFRYRIDENGHAKPIKPHCAHRRHR